MDNQRRYLFISRSNRGHINPMIGVAQWLGRAGHAVSWLTIPRDPAADEQIARIGARPVHPPDATVGYGLDESELARVFRNEPRKAFGMLVEMHTTRPRRNLEPVAALIRQLRPQVVVQDGPLYEGAIGATLAGIAFVNTSTSFRLAAPPDVHYQLTDVATAVATPRRQLFEEHGLCPEFRELECVSPTLNTVFSTSAFLPTDSLPERSHLVGPSLPIGARGDEPAVADITTDDKTIYLALGTVLHCQPQIATAVAEAAHALGATLVMAIGKLADDPAFRASLPATTQVYRYLPQLAVLGKVKVFVTHGGANSVTEGLLHGTPLLVIPLGLEQDLQRMFVERAGVGIGIPPDQVTAESCRDALARLLPEASPYRARAHEVRRSFAANDGARRAAELIGAL
ncbi:MAG: nucleotide disphospho-sugar-binding domain-containing protein [Kofleriaceae bacterium]